MGCIWADARDMLADSLATGGIDRTLLRNVGDNCLYRTLRVALAYTKYSAGFATILAEQEAAEKAEQ